MLNDHGDATEVLSVRSRPVRNPIFLGLGTAAILAAGGATTAAVAEPTPTPSPSGSEGSTPGASDTPTPTPTTTPTQQAPQTPVLNISLTATSATTVTAGKSVKARIHVYAAPDAPSTTLKLATSKPTTKSPTCLTAGCPLPTVDLHGVYRDVTITIPKGTSAGTITATATATDTPTGAEPKQDTLSITVKKAPTSSSKKTTHETSTDSSNSGGSGGSSGGSGGSGGSGSNNSTTSIPGSGSAYIPPSAAGQLAPATNGTAQFPQIAPQNGAGAAPPAVVGGQAAQNMGAVRGASPEPQELTFQRLASTQAAWLAALLVAFSLLLTHIRLNKPADARRRKGIHRRQRTGVFQA